MANTGGKYLGEIRIPNGSRGTRTIAAAKTKTKVQKQVNAYIKFMAKHGIDTSQWEAFIYLSNTNRDGAFGL